MTKTTPKKKSKPQNQTINLDFVMPDGKRLRQCKPAEIDAVTKFLNDNATIGELRASGPSAEALAFQITVAVIRGVESAKTKNGQKNAAL